MTSNELENEKYVVSVGNDTIIQENKQAIWKTTPKRT